MGLKMVGRCDDLVVMANKLELGKAQSYLLSGAPRNSLPSYPSFSVVALDTFSHCSGVFTEICFFHGNLIFFFGIQSSKRALVYIVLLLCAFWLYTSNFSLFFGPVSSSHFDSCSFIWDIICSRGHRREVEEAFGWLWCTSPDSSRWLFVVGCRIIQLEYRTWHILCFQGCYIPLLIHSYTCVWRPSHGFQQRAQKRRLHTCCRMFFFLALNKLW